MSQYENLSKSELEAMYDELKTEYNSYKAKNLCLDMSRGKPNPMQLSLSDDMLKVVISKEDYIGEKGVDYRNYGVLDGIDASKKLFAAILEVEPSEVIVGNNSSLNMMYDTVMRCLLFGAGEGKTPWLKQGKIKFLCPTPGYDRHFAICEHFGIEMIIIPMDENGPDMDLVKEYAENDESVKGIWCVPKYSNPTGITYSDEVVKAFADLNPKADDFRIFWDNAYVVHHLYEDGDELLNLKDLLKEKNKEDMIFIFGSTSKITHSGSGIAAFASSKSNIDFMKKLLSIQTIGSDKLNQLRHTKFLTCYEEILDHMKKHADIIRPRFEKVLEILDNELLPLGISEYTRPKGGYFISFDTIEGCAKRTVSLCKECGVTLTGAGATFPYGKDPFDKNIRIAPTYPPVEELEEAMKIFVIAVKMATIEKLLND
ncbi:MAG: aminotransferase class I/II-fold pyridoxal phosphate-dependent enzyme [Clostridia bacterium]|nr:aminotransferase class I/II-fold pyridoxal phosphate-dependent enzyme [Clostridia bacterium]